MRDNNKNIQLAKGELAPNCDIKTARPDYKKYELAIQYINENRNY